MININNLDDDSWISIIEYLRCNPLPSYTPLSYDLTSLASVSRHLRHLCFSTCIKKVSWRWHNPTECIPQFPPPSVGHYIRYETLHQRSGALPTTLCRELDFVIIQERTTVHRPYRSRSIYRVEEENCQEIISDLIITMVPSLYALQTVRITIGDDNHASMQLFMGPWHTFIEAIFLLPALESLGLEAPWFSEDEAFPSLTLRHAKLRRFTYRALFTWSRQSIRTLEYGRRGAEQIAVKTYNLQLLLDANRDMLEILELPGELADSLLDAPFPSLTKLSLFGYRPVDHTLAHGLPPQSNFQKLHIEIVSDSSPSPIRIASHLTSSQLAKMWSLTLSNPCLGDQLFTMLPPNLEHIQLIPYPVPFHDESDGSHNWGFLSVSLLAP
ncbi:hypothetical protein EDD85DRAFT_943652 [Armillaria nabsnona]|nr:hypothetical protein EDD85DRAFT_943652 [Armillaria nabsnona]